MPARGEGSDDYSTTEGQFCTTHWSVVLAADRATNPHSTEALEELCRAYWLPLYSYVRRRGYHSHDAEDLTQAFFERLLEKQYLTAADRDRGRFRTFLLSALAHFLANEWDKGQTRKRGGGAEVFFFRCR